MMNGQRNVAERFTHPFLFFSKLRCPGRIVRFQHYLSSGHLFPLYGQPG
ncbi:hypothetical protein BN130_705 [Cronobacter malonaticus 507]|nr:hypothetical protein BN131_320 [Cronobacter malonaticus 681]CCJ98166.1 hypothetical protein BN130_705 [Cronobacter malonaticus 507]